MAIEEMKEEARALFAKPIELSENAKIVLENRYLLKDIDGNIIETPVELFKRVAFAVAAGEYMYLYKKGDAPVGSLDEFYDMRQIKNNTIERYAKNGNKDVEEFAKWISKHEIAILPKAMEYYKMMSELDFLPNTPTLMNAGTELGQLSACFVIPVPDDIPGIFEAVKQTAIIQKSGGGCIAEGSKVFTSMGLTAIDDVYDKSGEAKEYKDGVYYKDVSGVYTYAFDGEKFVRGEIEKVWKYKLNKSDTVRVSAGGIELVVSDWHPFFIYDGYSVKVKRADELNIGDYIISPNAEMTRDWFFSDYVRVGDVRVDEDVAWLVGYFLGDGSLSANMRRVRFTDESEEIIKHVVDIVERVVGVKYTYRKSNRENAFEVAMYNKRLIKFFGEFSVGGVKYDNIEIPEFISRSPKSVVYSFLAGLIDSDGYIDSRGHLSYSTASGVFSEQLSEIVNILGGRTSIHVKKPKNELWHDMYEIRFIGDNRVYEPIVSAMINDKRKSRIVFRENPITSANVDFSLVEPLLEDAGINVHTAQVSREMIAIGGENVFVGRWKDTNSISSKNARKILAQLEKSGNNKDVIDKILFRMSTAVKVDNIEYGTDKEVFYDFTVKDFSNYIAGVNGFAVIHNTGFTFTHIREAGSVVNSTKGVASGAVSFMKVFDAATEGIKQGGKRRGANLGSIRYDHPDIEEFINVKDSDNKVLHNFNISVAVDDAFMEAVLEGGDIALKSPKDGHVVRTISASKLFDEIVEHAWKTGDPGLLFLDALNADNTLIDKYGLIETTNPCVLEGTLVNTPSGYKRVEDLKVGDSVSTVYGSEPIDRVEIHDDRDVYEVRFSDGGVQRVTASHIYYVIDNKSKRVVEKKVSELANGDRVRVFPSSLEPIFDDAEYKRGLKYGIMLGDGNYTGKRLSSRSIRIASSYDDEDYNSRVKELFGGNFGKDIASEGKGMSMVMYGEQAMSVVSELGLVPSYSFEKKIDITSVTNFSYALGIVDGLVATDGNVNRNDTSPQVRIVSSSLELLQNIRSILILLGMHGRIYSKYKAGQNRAIYGRKVIRKHDTYEIIISGSDLVKYGSYSKLYDIHPRKGESLREILRAFNPTGGVRSARVVSIEKYGKGKVYDLYCSSSDTWITDGYVQRGCGEQNLLPYESCNLGSINLAHMVDDDGEFNYEKFKELIVRGVQFLDNVVDVNNLPLPEIEEMNRQTRRIGLGVMGLADMFVKMGIEYGRDESFKMADKISSMLFFTALGESKRLGKERGSYLARDEEKLGAQRNFKVTSIAPTGTISIIAGCSSSIEPYFALSYKREFVSVFAKKGEEKHTLYEFNKYLEPYLSEFRKEELESLEERGNLSGLGSDREELKHLFITAHEIKPESHIMMQAVFQASIDAGVSKTINLPNDATPEDIRYAYMFAYMEGCKGITVFRDGSKSEQVLQHTKKRKEPELVFSIKADSLDELNSKCAHGSCEF